jgi:hypothetical protein
VQPTIITGMNSDPRAAEPTRKNHRVFPWVFLAIQVVFLGWVIYAGVSAPQSGPSPGVGLQVGLWVLTDLIAGASYAVWQVPRGPR